MWKLGVFRYENETYSHLSSLIGILFTLLTHQFYSSPSCQLCETSKNRIFYFPVDRHLIVQ